MGYILTDEDCKAEYAKLKQIDKFAKELGITIYHIRYSFKAANNEECLVTTPIVDNKLPDKWADKTYYLDKEQKKQVEKIDIKIRKMNDEVYDKVKKMFNDIDISMGTFHSFSYGSLNSMKN